MAKYGTTQYWLQHLENDTLKLQMMTNGFAHIIVESQSMSADDVIAMIEQLHDMVTTVSLDKSQYEKTEEEDDESQQ